MSPYYVHCKSFDGDLLALNLRKEHPDWIERWISGTIASELQKQKDEAIAQHKDFAFETNFSNDLILNMIGEFKEAGYKISLLYFGLGSLEESTTRVMQRKLFGGHDVANEIIEYNFYEGSNVYKKICIFLTISHLWTEIPTMEKLWQSISRSLPNTKSRIRVTSGLTVSLQRLLMN